MLPVIALLVAANQQTGSNAGGHNYTMMVIGDSWGELGPSWRSFQDMFNRHNVSVTVRSAAQGGTTACQWAGAADGKAMAELAAVKLFPGLKDGPDFVWYTLGGNDLTDKGYVNCSKNAKSQGDSLRCIDGVNSMITACTDKLLDNYWRVFPKSTVVQCGYDFPCESGKCVPAPRNPYCGKNVTCLNEGGLYLQDIMVDARVRRYNGTKPYVGLNVIGSVQAAGGVPGAAVGKPNMTVGSPCNLMTSCVHPTYKKAGAVAISEAFWSLYFKAFFTGKGVPFV